jgi:L-ascorbate metabolism protein UlaG (beta-lactamase superfamily)
MFRQTLRIAGVPLLSHGSPGVDGSSRADEVRETDSFVHLRSVADTSSRMTLPPAAATTLGAVLEARVTWLGHATTLLELDNVRLLTDPLLRPQTGLLRRRGTRPPPSKWSGVDAVLLSHLHHDHADLRSLRLLPSATPVITSEANADWLRRRGLRGVAASTERWHLLDRDRAIAVSLVPALHSSRPMPHRPNDAHGHLIRSPACRIWVAGDTSLFGGMKQVPDLLGGRVDLAVVPISGWGPRLSRGHLDPVQAAEACVLVGARAVLPVHWGTLHLPGLRNVPRGWMDQPVEQFTRALARLAPACEALLLKIGGSTNVPLPYRVTRRRVDDGIS